MTITFGDYLKELRAKKSFTLRGFATMIGMAPSYLSDIEQGKRNAPTKEYLDKMIKELNQEDLDVNTFYDLAKVGKAVPIAEDVKKIITEDKAIPTLCRKIKSNNINVENLIKDIERGKK
ncbi:hypothetical protein AGMMS49593_02370 [Endomicrobiia bacterium]|nr:hypothetical protein AGMMS49593_02370 [Endomicrobiia bacterium]GHT46571.1 hypothetical protein AGMMS49936_05730 [Endomicrobiia bacterium]